MIAAKCKRCGYIGCNGNNMICSARTEELVQDLKRQLLELDKYDATINYDCPTMSKEEDGEYVKLEDILNLFSPKTEIKLGIVK